MFAKKKKQYKLGRVKFQRHLLHYNSFFYLYLGTKRVAILKGNIPYCPFLREVFGIWRPILKEDIGLPVETTWKMQGLLLTPTELKGTQMTVTVDALCPLAPIL